MTFATLARTVRSQYLPAIRQQTQTVSSLTYPTYEPCNTKIAEFHKQRVKIRAIFGANRAGKTTAGAYELLSLARQYPGEIFWVGAVSYDFDRVCYKKLLEHVAPGEITQTTWIRPREQVPSTITLNNGSMIFFKSYETGSDKWQAEGIKAVWLDEQPPEQIFAEAYARTMDTEGYIFMTMTPLKGRDYIWKRIYKAMNPNIKHWTITLRENRYINPEEISIAESIYTQDERDSRLEGRFTVLEGAVLKEFHPDRHVIDPFPIPGFWPHSISIDLGFHNPFAVIFAALSPDNILYVYAGFKEAERLLEDHYAHINAIATDLSLYEAPGKNSPFYKFEVAICDHDAQERAELDNLGLYTIPAIKDVNLGFAILNRLFKHDRIQIFNTLPELPEELDGLVYKPISDRSDQKDVILKRDDHLTDCLRYMAMHYFGESDFALGSTEIITSSDVF